MREGGAKSLREDRKRRIDYGKRKYCGDRRGRAMEKSLKKVKEEVR